MARRDWKRKRVTWTSRVVLDKDSLMVDSGSLALDCRGVITCILTLNNESVLEFCDNVEYQDRYTGRLMGQCV